MIKPTQEFVEKNFDKTIKFIEDFVKNPVRKEKLIKLFEKYAEQYILCPASTKKEFYCAFPGGLSYHNLHVIKYMNKLRSTFEWKEITDDSIITVGLLHEIGKLGELNREYYVQSNLDNWHIEKGLFYEINQKISYMKIPHRSLFICQQEGIELNKEEYVAILLSDRDDDNKTYDYKEPKLASLLQMADKAAIKEEKELQVEFPLQDNDIK